MRITTATDHFAAAKRDIANAKRRANAIRIGRVCDNCSTCGRTVEVDRMADHNRYSHKAA